MTPDEVNESVTFMPADPKDETTLPMVEIGGIQVYVYMDDERHLRVSVDLDTVDEQVFPLYGDQAQVPMTITVQGDTVFEAFDSDGTYTEDDQGNWHEVKNPPRF